MQAHLCAGAKTTGVVRRGVVPDLVFTVCSVGTTPTTPGQGGHEEAEEAVEVTTLAPTTTFGGPSSGFTPLKSDCKLPSMVPQSAVVGSSIVVLFAYGVQDSAEECAEACRERSGCEYFIYGTTADQTVECWMWVFGRNYYYYYYQRFKVT